MGRFVRKRALVTGSTRGIGFAAAERLLSEGAEVVVHGRVPDDVRGVCATLSERHHGRVHWVAGDLADRSAVKRIVSDTGALDVLVNSAGIFEDRAIADADAAHWRRTIEINLTAPWLLAQGFLPTLRARQGVVVNVSSDAGLIGYAFNTVYSASKGALIGLTRALAVECAPDVRVLCVCPGPVETDMLWNAMAASTDPEAVRDLWKSSTFLRRVAVPAEIAAAIAYAASPDASFSTGNLVVVDGGGTAGKRVPPGTSP